MNPKKDLRQYFTITGEKLGILLYWLAIFPWAFDIRSEGLGEGLAYQAPILAVSIFFGFCLFFFRSHRSLLQFSPLFFATAVWFVLESITIGFVNGQNWYLLLSNSIPTALYVSYAYLTFKILAISRNTDAVLNALIQLCLIFGVACFAISFFKSGLDLDVTRYEIIGSAIVPSLGLAPAITFYSLRFIPLLVLAVTGLTVVISVTRTYLVVVAAQIACVFLGNPKIFLARRNLLFMGACLGLSICALLVGGISNAKIFERWEARLNAKSEYDGDDPTYLLRVAEVNFLKQAFFQSAYSMICGNGIAAETELIGNEAILAGNLVGKKSTEIQSIGFGHHNHWSLLFIGGVCAGLPLLVMQFSIFAQGIYFVHRISSDNARVASINFAGVWGAVIVMGTVLYGFLAGTMGNRGIALWYGVGTGLLLWAIFQRNHALTSNTGTTDKYAR